MPTIKMDTQLRIRTEHSYRTAIGKIPVVLWTLKRLGVKTAGIVDRHGTWGHIKWAQECKKEGVRPLFGVELAVVKDMEVREKQRVSYMSFLARNEKGLKTVYDLTTLATEKLYYTPRIDFGTVEDVLREGNLYVLGGDFPEVELKSEHFIREHNQINSFLPSPGPRVATVDNLYPRVMDKSVYEIIMGDLRSMRTAPGHILAAHEINWEKEEKAFAWAVANDCCVELPKAKMISPEVAFTLRELCVRGAYAKGIDLSNPIYSSRLDRELSLIYEKNFQDYFYVVADMIAYAKSEMFVGPARGSSCGSLVCYLLDITDIDPIPYDLLFERFIDLNREDLPDIDIDFAEDKREMVFDYLRNKYGSANVSRLGTVSVYKAKSAITDCAKQLQIPSWEVEDLKGFIIERSSGDSRATFCILDTFEQLEVGREALRKYPELKYSAALEGHARHTGVHAAGIIITAEPGTKYFSVHKGTGAAMLDKKDAEKINLLKIDALGLRTLSVIQDTLDSIGKSRKWLSSFPKDDQKVFDILNSYKFAGIFQYEGQALQSLVKNMKISHIEDVIVLTALGRPGPFESGGASEFIRRQNGLSEIRYLHPLVEKITAITHGIIVYQEQVMTIAREVGGLSWNDVSELRKAMSKSLGKEYFDQYWTRFVKGARKNGLKVEEAKLLWDNINTMGSWAFNRSHAVAYGTMSYWCMVLKAYYPLEFAAACLRNAKDDEQSIHILRELVLEGYQYKPFDRKRSDLNWSVKDGKLIGGLTGIKGVGAKLGANLVRKRSEGVPFTPREEKLLQEGETPWDHVFECEELWGHIKKDPKAYGIESPLLPSISEIKADADNTVVFIAKLITKNLRDHNENQSVERRGGRLMRGQTAYLNLILEDDSGTIPANVNRHRFLQYGKPLLEESKIGDWFIWKGEIAKGHRRLYVLRYKKLTGDENFSKKVVEVSRRKSYSSDRSRAKSSPQNLKKKKIRK